MAQAMYHISPGYVERGDNPDWDHQTYYAYGCIAQTERLTLHFRILVLVVRTAASPTHVAKIFLWGKIVNTLFVAVCYLAPWKISKKHTNDLFCSKSTGISCPLTLRSRWATRKRLGSRMSSDLVLDTNYDGSPI